VLDVQVVAVTFGNWLYRPETPSLESACCIACKSVDRFRHCRPVYSGLEMFLSVTDRQDMY
jgi:1,2-phenylacetyl-CoA epoxidase catalytic subunit